MSRAELLILGALAVNASAAEIKCPPMPDDLTRVTRDVTLDVKANAGRLGKISAPEVGVKTDVTAQAIFQKYPNLDKLIILQTLSSTYCSALNTSGISGTERLDRWERFMERYLELKSSVRQKPKAPAAASPSTRPASTKPAVRQPNSEAPSPRNSQAPSTVTSQTLATASSTPPTVDERYRAALQVAMHGDTEKSYPLFKDLAESGHAKSQYQVARALLLGDPGTQSYAMAFEWFKRAANAGYPPAQHNLAVMYQDGLGTSRDLNQAYIWFAEAARGGFFASQELLTKLGRTW
jgi:hypothetical protein